MIRHWRTGALEKSSWLIIFSRGVCHAGLGPPRPLNEKTRATKHKGKNRNCRTLTETVFIPDQKLFCWIALFFFCLKIVSSLFQSALIYFWCRFLLLLTSLFLLQVSCGPSCYTAALSWRLFGGTPMLHTLQFWWITVTPGCKIVNSRSPSIFV